jgi:nicotinate-nucleotide pyrophosphorylase
MRRFLLAMLVPLGTVVLPDVTAGAVVPKDQVLHHLQYRSSAFLQHQRLAAQASASLSQVATRLHITVDALRNQWQHVAWCEVHGNWKMQGPRYSGIGFLQSTWIAYGGGHFAQNAGRATVNEQILVGMRVTSGWVPDQYGCDPLGW